MLHHALCRNCLVSIIMLIMQALQAHGAQVTLTDRAIQVPLLQRNVAENFGRTPDCCCMRITACTVHTHASCHAVLQALATSNPA